MTLHLRSPAVWRGALRRLGVDPSALETSARPHKYHARRTAVDGHTFDSAGEAARYLELRALERAGLVTDLVVQPEYPIVVGVDRVCVCRYVADFSYVDLDRGGTVVEDWKAAPTRTPIYRLKRKLLAAVYGIEVVEVGPVTRRRPRPAGRLARGKECA